MELGCGECGDAEALKPTGSGKRARSVVDVLVMIKGVKPYTPSQIGFNLRAANLICRSVLSESVTQISLKMFRACVVRLLEKTVY